MFSRQNARSADVALSLFLSSAEAATVAPVAPAAQGQSRNWAGFAATGGTFTAVSGAWTVPNVSAGSTPGADATWVGIGGVGTTDLIQAGTDSTVQGGRVVYTAWMETLPLGTWPPSACW